MSSRNVLLVDDDEAVLAMLTRVLHASGFTVSAVSSADEATSLIDDQREFAMLIYDLSVGGPRGAFHVFEEFRKRRPNIPVLLVTGFASPDVEAEAERLGIEILQKPFGATELVDRVSYLIKRSHPAA